MLNCMNKKGHNRGTRKPEDSGIKKKFLSQNYKAAGGHFLVWYSSKFLII